MLARSTRTWSDEGIYDHKLNYDLDARRTVVTNPLGHATTYLYNDNGLVTEKHDARGGVTLAQYNEFNDLPARPTRWVRRRATRTMGAVTA